MRRPDICALVVLVTLLSGIGFPSHAQAVTVVTDCGTDNAPGAGINLDEAMAIGGRIEFACINSSTVIRITHPKDPVNATRIDGYNGGDQITLQNVQQAPGGGLLPIFETLPQDSLELYNLNLRNGLVDTPNMALELQGQARLANVTISDFFLGVDVGRGEITIFNSQFRNNNIAFSFEEVTSRVLVTGTLFRDNRLAVASSSSISGLAIPLDRLFVIEGSAFSGNGEAVRHCENCRVPIPLLTLANSMIVGGNAAVAPAVGGGEITLLNTTIVGNAGHGVKVSPGGTITLLNSIVANNGTNCAGTIADGGGNIQFPDVSCGMSIRMIEPSLGALLEPLIGSPALGAGDIAACTAPPVSGKDYFRKQRGIARCSSGAVEGPLEQPIMPPPIDELLERLR